ncbi:hypothetical protein SCLCIDRAFT_31584 [Scleroderma citrinum Foug A]|uniref:Uncharacterized protein n=1 Tax=Scleroderma citrinum Foug A TaxID=1036808 RepID=A0A0C2ZMJ9_9AGAM|nr:hypothetical protein SCLCIDRAFT_31584 [Scleroderma citrinum Foug A]
MNYIIEKLSGVTTDSRHGAVIECGGSVIRHKNSAEVEREDVVAVTSASEGGDKGKAGQQIASTVACRKEPQENVDNEHVEHEVLHISMTDDDGWADAIHVNIIISTSYKGVNVAAPTSDKEDLSGMLNTPYETREMPKGLQEASQWIPNGSETLAIIVTAEGMDGALAVVDVNGYRGG